MPDGTEPIDPDEIVYRRVLKGSAYKPDRKPPMSVKVFSPRDMDTDGLSLVRANYVASPEAAAALGADGMQFWIIALRAGDLIDRGLMIDPKPTPECLGHAVISNINAMNRDDVRTQELMLSAISLAHKAYGVYPGKAPHDPPPL